MRYALDTEDVIRSFEPEWKRPSDGHAGGGAFRCNSPEEVDQVYRALLGAGGSAHKEPWDAFWGQRYAQVKDPDGTVIDLYAAVPDSSRSVPSGAERSDETVDVHAARPPAARRA